MYFLSITCSLTHRPIHGVSNSASQNAQDFAFSIVDPFILIAKRVERGLREIYKGRELLSTMMMMSRRFGD